MVYPAGYYDPFQFTRPRGARQASIDKAKNRVKVSIHAPAWGATTRGGIQHHNQQRFNSRARVGRDLKAMSCLPRMDTFQFTRPRGARRAASMTSCRKMMFQFTRPRGARRSRGIRCAIVQGRFNSRARVGRDSLRRAYLPHRAVSIHAPAWGATAGCATSTLAILRFNSRARVGRDGAASMTSCRKMMFQFTRPRGARHLPTYCLDASLVFQFTRPRGARRSRGIRCAIVQGRFNSRARVGRD